MTTIKVLVVVVAYLLGFATSTIINASQPVQTAETTPKTTVIVPCPTGTQVIFTGISDDYYCLTPEEAQQYINSKK